MSRPVKVLVVDDSPGLWGAQRYLLRLAPGLRAQGYEQILLSPSGDFSTCWAGEGLPHLALDVRQRKLRGEDGGFSLLLLLLELWRVARGAVHLARLSRRHEIGLLHGNAHWTHLEVALAGKLCRKPVILHLHEETLPGIARHLRSVAVLLATETVAVSAAVASCLNSVAQRRTTVVISGIDPTALELQGDPAEIRRELAHDPQEPVVLVMGRLDRQKGVDHVIRAVAQLTGALDGTQLAVAGAGSLDAGWGEHLSTLGETLLGARMRFLGVRADVGDILRASDLLVLASSTEGLGLSILEAQACGTCVVAYRIGGVPEIVEHGVTGLLAKPGDVTDLSRQIASALSSPALREELSATARQEVLARRTLARQVDELALVMERARGGRHRKGGAGRR